MTHASQQRRMERLWKKWRDRLGLYGWDVTRTYHAGDFIQADGRPSSLKAAPNPRGATSALYQIRPSAGRFCVW